MVTEDYCSYEVAKLLKEKGFNTFKSYGWDEQLFDKEHPRNFSIGFDNKEHWISCPTQSMAMKWLREEHNIFIQISAVLQDQPFGLHYRPSIQDYHAYARHDNFSEYVTYEEAVEAACIYLLKNLI